MDGIRSALHHLLPNVCVSVCAKRRWWTAGLAASAAAAALLSTNYLNLQYLLCFLCAPGGGGHDDIAHLRDSLRNATPFVKKKILNKQRKKEKEKLWIRASETLQKKLWLLPSRPRHGPRLLSCCPDASVSMHLHASITSFFAVFKKIE